MRQALKHCLITLCMFPLAACEAVCTWRSDRLLSAAKRWRRMADYCWKAYRALDEAHP